MYTKSPREQNMKPIERLILKKVRKNGCFNLFFDINGKIGLKLSQLKSQRDENYENQKKVYELGYAPKVYGKIDNVQYKGVNYFGYFTEVVETLGDNLSSSTPEDLKHKKEIRNIYREQIEKLVDIINQIFYFYDSGLGNFGIKDGKLICIDFDSEETIDNNPCVNFSAYF